MLAKFLEKYKFVVMDDVISPASISVVINGLVVGSSRDEEKAQITKRALQSIRKYLPKAQIILSSWKGSDVSGLDYDDLALSEPPAPIYVILDEKRRKLLSTNHQITSARNGLKLANREYTLRIRSDISLTGKGFISYFLKFNKDRAEFFKKRILTLPTFNPRRTQKNGFLFNACDWLVFGLTEDIKDLYDIPLIKESDLTGPTVDGYHFAKDNFGSEQYLWMSFLKKHQNFYLPYNCYSTRALSSLSEETYAKNLIMVPAHKAGFISLKMPHAAYGAVPILSQGLYTFNEYKKMFNRYNAQKVFYIPNPFEDIIYFICLHGRIMVRNTFPDAYKAVINTIRRRNESHDLLE